MLSNEWNQYISTIGNSYFFNGAGRHTDNMINARVVSPTLFNGIMRGVK